jgi:glutathione peroxidase
MRLFILLYVLINPFLILGQNNTIYQFSAKTIDGNVFDFNKLEGKKVLIINTASKCSLASQIKKLQELYEEYGGDDFEIIAFPCNDFGKREPDDNNSIKDFYLKKYNNTFLLMEKIKIKGDEMHPLYKWLTSSKENGNLDARVTWNFQKFLINEKGETVDFVPPIKSPKCKRIVEWLQE